MKLIAIKQLKSGKNIEFINDNFQVIDLNKALDLAKKGVLENVTVITSLNNKKYLRAVPNQSSEDNLENIAITCYDSDYLYFDRKYLYLRGGNHKAKKQWIAFSGNPKATISDQNKADFGPLPEGKYIANFENTLDFKENKNLWDALNWLRKSPAWGLVATPLIQVKGESYKRGDFYIHVGWTKGTAGCIEINGLDNGNFHSFIRLYQRNFKLIVRYASK